MSDVQAIELVELVIEVDRTGLILPVIRKNEILILQHRLEVIQHEYLQDGCLLQHRLPQFGSLGHQQDLGSDEMAKKHAPEDTTAI